MKRLLFLPSLFLGLALLAPSLYADSADEIAKQDTEIKALDTKITATTEQAALVILYDQRGSAYRLRALELEKLSRYAEAESNYIISLNDTRKSTGRILNREAELFARVAHCQFKQGQYKFAKQNMDFARTARGWIPNEPFFLQNSAKIRLASEEYDAAIADAIAIRAGKSTNTQKANSYMLEATAIYLQGDYTGAMNKWKEIAPISAGLAEFKPFDLWQASFNKAIAMAPTDLTARLKRIQFFRDRANQKRYPKLYTSNSPTDQGGLTNLIDYEVFDVQPQSFDQAAYYDWTKVIEIKAEPAYYAERALVGHLWNEVAKDDWQKLPQKEISNDINYALNNSRKNGETLRAIGRFYEDSSPSSVYDPKWRPNTRNAIYYYSLALIHDPTYKENDQLRQTLDTRINFYISAKPPEAPKVKPTTPLEWKERGNELTGKDQFSAALDAYDKALELDPKFADANNNKGNIYMKLGAYDLALKEFDAATVSDPKHRIAYYNLSTLWQELGDIPKAVDNASKAIQFATIQPHKVQALYQRADLYFKLQRYPQSLTDLTAVVTLEPKNAPSWAFRGQVEIMTKALPAAIASFEKAASLDPTRERTKLLLVTAQHLNGSPAPKILEGKSEEKLWVANFLVSTQFKAAYPTDKDKARIKTLIELTK